MLKFPRVPLIIDNHYERPYVCSRVVVDALLVLGRQIFLIPQLLNCADWVFIIHTTHYRNTNWLLSQFVHLEAITVKVALLPLRIPGSF